MTCKKKSNVKVFSQIVIIVLIVKDVWFIKKLVYFLPKHNKFQMIQKNSLCLNISMHYIK